MRPDRVLIHSTRSLETDRQDRTCIGTPSHQIDVSLHRARVDDHCAFKHCLSLPLARPGYMHLSRQTIIKPERGNPTCRSTSKSRPRPRRSARKYANGCTEECIPAKRTRYQAARRGIGPAAGKARARGLWCPWVPKEYGGMGLAARQCAGADGGSAKHARRAVDEHAGPDDTSMMTISPTARISEGKILKPLLNGDKPSASR